MSGAVISANQSIKIETFLESFNFTGSGSFQNFLTVPDNQYVEVDFFRITTATNISLVEFKIVDSFFTQSTLFQSSGDPSSDGVPSSFSFIYSRMLQEMKDTSATAFSFPTATTNPNMGTMLPALDVQRKFRIPGRTILQVRASANFSVFLQGTKFINSP